MLSHFILFPFFSFLAHFLFLSLSSYDGRDQVSIAICKRNIIQFMNCWCQLIHSKNIIIKCILYVNEDW